MTHLDQDHHTLDQALSDDLATLERAGLTRILRSAIRHANAEITCEGDRLVDFASNDYLGLAADGRIASAAVASVGSDVSTGAVFPGISPAAIASHTRFANASQAPTPQAAFGAAAARLVSGNHPLHIELERAVARFKNTESALCFNSGYTANIGAIPALVGRRDVIYADELNHASLIDGCRLSRAELRVLPHLDVGALDAALTADAGRFRRKLVVVDAVFSMDGDLYPLDALVEITRRHGAWSYVDDAHGTGVLGDNGRGSSEFWGVEGEIDVVMGTLGKAIGTAGAFIAGSKSLTDYLLNRARSFIYTTGAPPITAAAAIEGLRIATAEPWRRAALRDNAVRLREALSDAGLQIPGERDSHIIPVVIGDSRKTMQVSRDLYRRGFLVGAIRPPTVPMGSARLRITVSAAHSAAQIDALAVAVAECMSGNATSAM